MMRPVTHSTPAFSRPVFQPSPQPSTRPSKPAPAPDSFERPQPGRTRPANPDAYFTGFKQGGAGNCVSVAAIKAAMTKFGPDNVFKSVSRSGNGYDITMRDGVKVRVSDAELSTASRQSRISGRNPELVRKANLMYAVMAKRAQRDGNDGLKNMSFERACRSLNDGESYLEGPRWLGLKDHMRKINPDHIDRYSAAVGASSRHAVFASGGYVDHYGRKRAGSRNGMEIEGYGRPLRGAYALV
jgi:hypothetical protein